MTQLNRRRFLEVSAGTAVASVLPASRAVWAQSTAAPMTDPAQRGLLLYVDPRLGPKSKAHRQSVEAAVAGHPLLHVLAGGKPLLQIASPTPVQLAYNHVLLIALPDDPLLKQAWQREALIQPLSSSVYAFGFGNLQGSIGYIESDRNPFLHAAAVPKAPYECEWVTVTGTNVAGLDSALDAFLTQGLVNGLIAAPGWKRGAPTLLDRDPLARGFTIPSAVPKSVGSLQRIGVTQVAEDEYRGALADAGVMPLSIWQAKYYDPGQWDGVGQVSSFYSYVTGLHRRAYGNAVWAATFASAADAASAAPRIAGAAKLKPSGPGNWKGDLPRYAWGIAAMGDGDSTGTLELLQTNDTVLLTAMSRRLN